MRQVLIFVLLITTCCRTSQTKKLKTGGSETDKQEDTKRGKDVRTEFPTHSEESVAIIGKMVDLNQGERDKVVNTKSGQRTDGAAKEVELKQEHQENSQSSLVVERSLVNMTKDSGETAKMRCEFKGHPPPSIQWYKNEAPLEPERGKVDLRKYTSEHGAIGSRLRITGLDIHDTGYYKCEATNGKDVVETTGILMVKAGRMHIPSMIPNFPASMPHFPDLGGRLPEYGNEEFGLCQSYHGVACSHLVGNRTVYVKASQTLAYLEAKLASLFQALASTQEMKSECHMYAIPFFCFIMFPPCDETMPYPEPRHVCRDDCEILESTTCRDEISSVRRHPVMVQQDLVPDCADLPALPQGVGGIKDGQRCISLNIPRVDHDQTCYEGRGESYRGPVKHTMSAHQCQNWRMEPDFKELSGSHNYCRNPGGVEPQPWCFISDPHIRREICDIPRCDDYSWLYILLPTATGVALLSIFVAVWCKRQKRKSCSTKLSPQRNIQLIPTHHSGHQHHRHSHHHHSSHQQIEMQKFLPRLPPCVHEVPAPSISFLHELGEGIFGKVYRGEIHHSGGSIIPVAIKTLREGASTQAQQEFSREIESISTLQHQNVVCLIAVCVKEEPFCMMFEYMFQCDLHEYLLVHSPHSDVSARSEDGTPYILELSDFLAISIQIACGMEYLSSKGYVHRDLAARNCLVGAALSSPGSQTCLSSNTTQASSLSNITVKISDLGVSRNSCASDYFRIRNTLLPVRWMAPESLLYGTFTTESDVWSFGVLLWEIFSYGIQPYFNYDNQEVIDLICAHQLLPRPEYCPSYVYAIMNDSWHDSTSHRPGFKEIYNRLCTVHSLHERTYSISHSVLTHNSSHPSSTGPSNKTLSTNLSNGTVAHNPALSLVTSDINGAPSCNVNAQRTTQPMASGSIFPFCGSTSLFVASKIIPGHKTHQCEQV